MNDLEIGSFSEGAASYRHPDPVRLVCWNVNRGLLLAQVIEFLTASSADLILLQEVDINARRTRFVNVARTLAEALNMNYVFGREFEELGQNHGTLRALHGQATLSRFPLGNSRILCFSSQSGFWRPRLFIPNLPVLQRRRGARMALISEIKLQHRRIVVYNAHLESRGRDDLRHSQFTELLADVKRNADGAQVIVSGDMNFDLSQEPAASMIASSGLQSPFARFSGQRTAQKRTQSTSAAIDWILTHETLATGAAKIHDQVRGSDHYPLSLEIYL